MTEKSSEKGGCEHVEIQRATHLSVPPSFSLSASAALTCRHSPAIRRTIWTGGQEAREVRQQQTQPTKTGESTRGFAAKNIEDRQGTDEPVRTETLDVFSSSSSLPLLTPLSCSSGSSSSSPSHSSNARQHRTALRPTYEHPIVSLDQKGEVGRRRTRTIW